MTDREFLEIMRKSGKVILASKTNRFDPFEIRVSSPPLDVFVFDDFVKDVYKEMYETHGDEFVWSDLHLIEETT